MPGDLRTNISVTGDAVTASPVKIDERKHCSYDASDQSVRHAFLSSCTPSGGPWRWGRKVLPVKA